MFKIRVTDSEGNERFLKNRYLIEAKAEEFCGKYNDWYRDAGRGAEVVEVENDTPKERGLEKNSKKIMFSIYTRTWWRRAKTPGRREPFMGEKKVIRKVRHEAYAKDFCERYNIQHEGNFLGRKAEYEEEEVLTRDEQMNLLLVQRLYGIGEKG